MMTQPITYFSLVFMTFIAFTVDKIIFKIRVTLEDFHDRKEEAKKIKMMEFAKKVGSREPSLYRRKSGYVFSQEDHLDPRLVEPMIRNSPSSDLLEEIKRSQLN